MPDDVHDLISPHLSWAPQLRRLCDNRNRLYQERAAFQFAELYHSGQLKGNDLAIPVTCETLKVLLLSLEKPDGHNRIAVCAAGASAVIFTCLIQECLDAEGKQCFEPAGGWPFQLIVKWQVVRGLLQLLRQRDIRGVSSYPPCAVPSDSAAELLSKTLKTGTAEIHKAFLEQSGGLSQLTDALLYFPIASLHAADALYWVASGPLGADTLINVPLARPLLLTCLKVMVEDAARSKYYSHVLASFGSSVYHTLELLAMVLGDERQNSSVRNVPSLLAPTTPQKNADRPGAALAALPAGASQSGIPDWRSEAALVLEKLKQSTVDHTVHGAVLKCLRFWNA